MLELRVGAISGRAGIEATDEKENDDCSQAGWGGPETYVEMQPPRTPVQLTAS
jgi:hypothetical protein